MIERTDQWVREGHPEPHEDAIVKVEHHSLERGSITRYLEPGQLFEVKNDEPTWTKVEAVGTETPAQDQ